MQRGKGQDHPKISRFRTAANCLAGYSVASLLLALLILWIAGQSTQKHEALEDAVIAALIALTSTLAWVCGVVLQIVIFAINGGTVGKKDGITAGLLGISVLLVAAAFLIL